MAIGWHYLTTTLLQQCPDWTGPGLWVEVADYQLETAVFGIMPRFIALARVSGDIVVDIPRTADWPGSTRVYRAGTTLSNVLAWLKCAGRDNPVALVAAIPAVRAAFAAHDGR